eukprot:4399991-Prorocentrum_lima.AAC.1
MGVGHALLVATSVQVHLCSLTSQVHHGTIADGCVAGGALFGSAVFGGGGFRLVHVTAGY